MIHRPSKNHQHLSQPNNKVPLNYHNMTTLCLLFLVLCSFLSADSFLIRPTYSNSKNLIRLALEEEDDSSPTVEEEDDSPPLPLLPGMEKTWRYANKPLISIGAKGATLSHGNSLRQLLEAHTVVKVKVNTQKFDNSLEKAFEQLRDLAVESGAPADLELLQVRPSQKVILFGLPGTRERIESNNFPPPPPPPYVRPEREQEEEE
jgi:RNA-binding protein YhbY